MKTEVISEKGSGKSNEDSFTRSNNTFGVFDGAGSLTKFMDEQGHTSGFLASHIASMVFQNETTSLFELTEKTNTKLKEEMISHTIDVSKGVNRWSTTVSAIRTSDNTFDWVNIGDSVILSIHPDGSYKLISPYLNHDIEVLQLVKGLAGKGTDDLWSYTPFIEASTVLQNNRNITYGVLDGSEEAKKFISHGTESLEGIQHILLLTDGCYIPQENPDGKEDFTTVIKTILVDGLEGLRKLVRTMQDSDPHFSKYPRFKHADDFTAMLISPTISS